MRVQREREFCPHHVLPGAACTALEDAEEKRPGYFNYELMCISFCALAREALGNAFGEKFISRWYDFENASLIAKLRLVCDHFRLKPDFEQEPWSAALWLVRFRNRVAHARPEFVKMDRIVTREEYDKIRLEYPASKLATQVTLANAQRAFDCVSKIHKLICDCIPVEQIGALFADGWSGQASLYTEA
jgi:hypothetical protein